MSKEAIRQAEFTRLAAYDAADRLLDEQCLPAYKVLKKANKKAYKAYERATAEFQNANRTAYDAADAAFNEVWTKGKK
jgi:hypothetical protein